MGESRRRRFVMYSVFILLYGLAVLPAAAQDRAAVVAADFDDGTLNGWIPRGGVTLRAVTGAQRSGTMSLLTTGRTAGWHGPSLDLSTVLVKGAVYRISGWVRLARGMQASLLKFTVQRGQNQYDQVNAPVRVTDTDWVLIEGTYSFAEDARLLLYLESDDPGSAYYLEDFAIRMVTPPPETAGETAKIQDLPSLHQAYRKYFSIGAAIETYQTAGLHARMLKRHFSTITAENVMKPGPIQPSEGSFNWNSADQIARFARENGMKMRFHTLQWHSQAADWMFLDENGADMSLETDPVRKERNRKVLLERLEKHIRAVVTRYRDVVESWDVVNEVIDAGESDGLRRSRWYLITGSEFIERAFRAAREAAGPQAKLYINDYGTENPSKRDALFNLVQSLLAKGVPVDGVGHQTHIGIASPPMKLIVDSIRKFASLGLDNQITELDLSIYSGSERQNAPTEEQLLAQAYRYRDLFDALVSVEEHVSNVTFWGIGDDHTWLSTRTDNGGPRTDWPLLFDTKLQAKPAFWALIDPGKLPVKIQNVNAFRGSPVADGKPELIWDVVRGTDVRGKAVYRTLWSDGRLYVYAEVNDPEKDTGDTVELFIDGNNGRKKAWEADDRAIVLHRSGAAAGGTAAGVEYAVREISGGYRLEASIPVREAAEGKKIGFDLRITDPGSGEKVSWNDPSNGQDTNTAVFGTVTLLPAVQTADSVRGTPVIDGVEDALWKNAPEMETGVLVTGSKGATAKVKTLWDTGNLYVLFMVTDALLSDASLNAWEEDSVEIFLDLNNGRTETYEGNDGQYRVNFRNVRSFAGMADSENFITSVRTVAGGYIVEAALRVADGVLKTGAVLGFDVQVNDDRDGNGVRDGVMIWNDSSGLSYLNTSRFGALRLVDK